MFFINIINDVIMCVFMRARMLMRFGVTFLLEHVRACAGLHLGAHRFLTFAETAAQQGMKTYLKFP